ncbi:hypothetical protein Pmani_025472 [Petrolisthes manimaculis]|uniref:Uncharacterized protein n=1 Tax=Petrolisthes manimaculis TaxID=1843537 RepID=A0AAE1P5G2_9EUCA|nr:hypothetical protein Pmani_025472 [Petrolisthes manimaculis]
MPPRAAYTCDNERVRPGPQEEEKTDWQQSGDRLSKPLLLIPKDNKDLQTAPVLWVLANLYIVIRCHLNH